MVGLFVYFFGLLSLVSCATIMPSTGHGHHHHHPHTGPTHESNEHSKLTFFYDYMSHYFIAKGHSSCYFMSLSPEQQMQVHLPSGIENLEFSMIRMIDGNEDTLTSDQIIHMSTTTKRACQSKILYKLGDLVTKQPSVTMIPI